MIVFQVLNRCPSPVPFTFMQTHARATLKTLDFPKNCAEARGLSKPMRAAAALLFRNTLPTGNMSQRSKNFSPFQMSITCR
jgi:hypothetical protein